VGVADLPAELTVSEPSLMWLELVSSQEPDVDRSPYRGSVPTSVGLEIGRIRISQRP
jgi:hypothetical protein